MNDVTNIAAKRNKDWLEGAEHGRKAERERIREIVKDTKAGDANVDWQEACQCVLELLDSEAYT